MVSAVVETLGIFKQNECVALVQSCANCTYNTITSIQTPLSQIISLNAVMNKNGTFYTYDFCNTSINGNYIVNGIGNPNGEDTIWAYNFIITPTGYDNTTAQGLIYVFLLLVSIVFMIIAVVGAVKINPANEYDIGGKIMSVNYGKYLKMGLFFVSYLLFILVAFLSWQIADSFLMVTTMTWMFHTFFIILVSLLAPIFIAFVVLALVKWTADLELWKLAERNLQPRNKGRR
jgi:hypothetical protein